MYQLKNSIKQGIFSTLPRIFLDAKAPSRKTGVASLLCHRDVTMYIYAVYSLFFAINQNLPLYVVDDGTLTAEDKQRLAGHFTITIITRGQLLRRAKTILQTYPNIKKFMDSPEAPVIKWKLLLKLVCPFKRFIIYDADILFFQKSPEIAQWLSNPNKVLHLEYEPRERTRKHTDDECYLDLYHSYRQLLVHSSAPGANPLFNTGLVCIPDKSLFELSTMNRLLGILKTTYFDNQFGSDEVIVGSVIAKRERTPLPKKRYVIQFDTIRRARQNIICLHYCWRAKALFQLDAIRLAVHTRGFRFNHT
ncbi:hypothetical protein HZB58_01695 [Candidatus Gottesmanbacteria bacterium]|nr:hypothetical protein [Candidatus Gottesmanbacteria bacterium]